MIFMSIESWKTIREEKKRKNKTEDYRKNEFKFQFHHQKQWK